MFYVIVKNIKLINYRNYKSLSMNLDERLNLFLGNNGQGKTNLLEAIYLSSTGKSFRTSKDKELICIDKNEGYVGVNVEKTDNTKLIEVKLERSKNKRVKVNRIEIEKLSEIKGQLHTVLFSPEDLKIIKEGPSERRNFLDTEISQIRPYYYHNLNKYNRVLFQRNNLLKKLNMYNNNKELLEVYNIQLANIGTEIIINRIYFIRKISSISKEIHNKLSGGLEDLKLEYISSVDIKKILSNIDEEVFNNIKSLKDTIKSEVHSTYLTQLNENIETDIVKRTTQIGPHRDDISVKVNGLESKTFGSQGQQRTAALSLKLAEIDLIKVETDEYPVLLLDDVLSELDINRRKFLITTFKDIQTIITSTDKVGLKEIEDLSKSTFHIENGKIISYDKTI